MIFPNLELEPVVQVADKTRLSAVKSYGSKGEAITKVEIQPYAGGPWIDVTGSPISTKNWYTDWEYDTAGTKVVSLRVNDGSPSAVTITKNISVITEADDALFATDADLAFEEPEILKYVKDGRNSYKDVHREAQKQILDLLNRKGYRTTSGGPITKANVKDLTQVREMAKYLALHIVFEGLSNVVGDVFSAKSQGYRGQYTTAQDRQIIGLDLNEDGEVDTAYGEGVDLSAARLIRR